MFTLAEYGGAVAMDTAFWYQAVEDETYPLNQFGKVTLNLENSLRALANMSLLVHHDIARFKANLGQAAWVRLKYLGRIHQAQCYDDHHYATGRYAHIVDAIAGGHLDMAQQIHRQSPEHFAKGREYLDDFCFGAMLGEWSQSNVNTERLDQLLEEFENFLSGDEDPRYMVMEALRKQDSEQFDEGMTILMEHHELRNSETKDKGAHLDATEIALQRISTEGICLLNLAPKAGIEIRTVYKFSPLL